MPCTRREVLSESTLATCGVSCERRKRARSKTRAAGFTSRAPAFSPLVYLCKYSPSIYNNTRVLCAPHRGGGGGTRHGHMPRKITVIAG